MTVQTIRVARVGLRCAAPVVVAAVCLWWLAARVEPGTFNNLPRAIGTLPPLAVLCAILFTLLSFYAVGRYDAVAHRHFQTGVPAIAARTSGTLAVALSQTLGFGLFTGAAVRWRMLPGLRFADALRLSGFVCISFLMAMGFITALACLILKGPDWALVPALLILTGLGALVITASFAPICAPLRHRRMVPSLSALGAIGIWSAADLVAAALVLYALIPAGDLPFATFLPVFLIAYGGALISGAPGGAGPFELALLALLPQVPATELLAGVLAYRVLYFAVPAVIAAVGLLRPFERVCASQKIPFVTHAAAIPPKTEVMHYPGQDGVHLRGKRFLVWPTNQTVTAFCATFVPASASALIDLQDHAKAQNRIPLLYKCSGTTAATARRNGWHVARIADEASINPMTFSTAPRACRGLRRKLRQAAVCGVEVREPARLPHSAMATLDTKWQRQKGGARGGTMGRFCPTHLQDQRVFLAYVEARLVGFMTFHVTADRWCLDLVRCPLPAPDGTAHLLVAHALQLAAKDGITKLSLDAVPAHAYHLKGLSKRLARVLMKRGGAAGLRQFKGSFAPSWQPRYAAAPNACALALGLADVAMEVHFPAPLPETRGDHANTHKGNEDYEIDLHIAA